METKKLTTVCIMCPVGCTLTIEKTGDNITVTGNQCNKGVEYGKSEITEPKRIVTSLIKNNSFIASVKTDGLIPKDKISEILNIIKELKPDSLKINDVVVNNVLNTGVNIVVTGINLIS